MKIFRHTFLGLVGLLMFMALPSTSSAQCGAFSYSYSETSDVYYDWPQTGGPTTVYFAVSVSGSANMPPSCPGISQAKHTPNATLIVGGVGGTTHGTPVCPNCYASVQTTRSMPFSSLVDTPTTDTEGGSVQCTIAGTFFSVGGINNRIEVGQTKSANYGVYTVPPAPHAGILKLEDWCVVGSEPPDWNPDALDLKGDVNVHAYYYSLNICQRPFNAAAGTKWTCGIDSLGSSLSPLVMGADVGDRFGCTNFDKGYKGSFSFVGALKVAWLIFIKTF